jgi:hypothetical protein
LTKNYLVAFADINEKEGAAVTSRLRENVKFIHADISIYDHQKALFLETFKLVETGN